MTTWVQEEDLDRCFGQLDAQRLNAQRGGEGLILARGHLHRLLGWCAAPDCSTIHAPGTSFGWQTHPAAVMWRGHERAFMRYQILACREWRRRGYDDGCLGEYVTADQLLADLRADSDTRLPDWWGYRFHRIHAVHRMWLLNRNWHHYAQFGWFAEMDELRRWKAYDGHGVVGDGQEPPLEWPVSGITSAGEGASPLGRSDASP